MYTFCYVNMPNITAGYGRRSLAIFEELSYIITCLIRYNFIKLSQIMCYGRGVEKKSKPCNHLYMVTSV